MNYVMTDDLTENRNSMNINQTVKKYGSKLLGFIKSKVRTLEDAEDILQDVWYQFLGLSSADEIESISGWLYKTAKYRIIDFYRKKKPALLEGFSNSEEEDVPDIMDILLRDESPSPELEFIKELFWVKLNDALKELPGEQRTTFIKNEFENMTLQEIADSQGENLKTVISRKNYAVKYLRKKLKNLLEEF